MPTSLNTALLAVFQAHGVEGKLDAGGHIDFGASKPALRSFLHSSGEHGWRLEVELYLPDGTLLSESFGGLAKTGDEATQLLLSKFVRGSLDVLLAAFFGSSTANRVQRESWTIDGECWTVYMGPVLREKSRGSVTDAAVVPDGLFEILEDSMREQSPLSGIRWCRCFVARQDNAIVGNELLVNDIHWPGTAERIEALDWSEATGYTAIRIFCVLRRGKAPHGYASEKHGLSQVMRGVGALGALRDQSMSNEELETHLQETGCEQSLAEKIAYLAPEAFGTVLMHEFALPQTYEMADHLGQTVLTRSWSSESVFSEAHDLACHLAENDREAFLAIAGRASLTHAVNDALNGGMSIEDVGNCEFSTPRMWMATVYDQLEDEATGGKGFGAEPSDDSSGDTEQGGAERVGFDSSLIRKLMGPLLGKDSSSGSSGSSDS